MSYYQRSSVKCPNCGNDLWDVIGNVAMCGNCFFERPYKRREHSKEITPSQKKAIEWLKREIIKHDGLHSDEYEYKEFRFEKLDFGGKVSLVSVVGGIRDEGTVASILCRVRRHIFIGPHGGLELVNTAKYIDGKKVSAKVNARGRKVVWALTE